MADPFRSFAAFFRRFFSRRVGSPRSQDELLRICHGDHERAERLIELELSRAPGITTREACARAVARYRADNR